MKEVWMCGGGTQSCAIAALIIEGALPKPDFAVIADTGREAQTTWAYLDLVLTPALSKVGIVVNRISSKEWGYGGIDLFSKTDELLLPVFSTQTFGSVGKLSAFCNRWWKLDSMRRWLSEVHGLTRSKYRSWIGFSLDEQRRYFRMMDGEEYRKGLIWFPLVEKRLRRQQSIELVKAMGWSDPPRSRCYMCPNQSDSEWQDLKQNSPTEFAAAVAIDTQIRERDQHAWLHKSCKPLQDVDFTEQDELFNRACESGTCFL